VLVHPDCRLKKPGPEDAHPPHHLQQLLGLKPVLELPAHAQAREAQGSGCARQYHHPHELPRQDRLPEDRDDEVAQGVRLRVYGIRKEPLYPGAARKGDQRTAQAGHRLWRAAQDEHRDLSLRGREVHP